MPVKHVVGVIQAQEMAIRRLLHRTQAGPGVKIAQPLYSQKTGHEECNGVVIEREVDQLIEEMFRPGIVSPPRKFGRRTQTVDGEGWRGPWCGYDTDR